MARSTRARWPIGALVLFATNCSTDQGQTSSGSACDISEIESGTGFPEMRGEGAEAWALLWETPPWEVGQDVKVVWKMGGSGDFEVHAVGPDGEIVGPTSGPTGPRNSNWDRTGQEWGTFFNLPSEGCWQLEDRRTDAVSTVTIDVITA